MPDFPIVDTHLHIWDFGRLNYAAFTGHPLFGKSYQIEDYQRDCGELDIEAMVFLECYADFTTTGGQYIEEIKFVEDSAQRDPRIKGIVPMAPLEWGERVEPMLAEMAQNHPTVKGIRRIVHPNLWIKLSDLPVEADHQNWTEQQLRPFIDALPDTEICKRWWAFMADIMETDNANVPTQIPLKQVFHLP